MIPLPPHRTKGPAALGATRPGATGPFVTWPHPAEPEDRDHHNTPEEAPVSYL